MLFRALLGMQVTASSLEISPTLPQEVERLTTKSPVLYGGKEILFLVRNGEGAIRSVRLNGKAYRQHSPASVTLPHEALAAKNLVEIEMHG
jgi:cellobiose phosphorylase